ncbi:MAG: RNA-binding protein [Streptococcaceae bacterium]|jgi:RNA-binding protein YlmH|nr:RNA-binding protein [Streptococcaceae bacterium]
MNENVYQHFRTEEHAFIDYCEELLEKVENEYRPILSRFLDPRERFIFESVIGGRGFKFEFYGGYEGAERSRALLYPEYHEVSTTDFEIATYEIQYPIKFATLTHRSILGSVMSIGLDRALFGDIITDGEHWQLFLEDRSKEYITMQFTAVGKTRIRLEEIDYTKLLKPIDVWVEEVSTVSSLRIDTVIAEVFRLSRSKVKTYVQAGKVKLNFHEEDRPNVELEINDVISVRGLGRLKIERIEGKTKKEKIRTAFLVLRN